MTTTEERREHRRLPITTSLHCKRLGRGGFDEKVTSADLSAGGALLRADRRLGVGDVLSLDLELSTLTLQLKGLVIATREIPDEHDDRYVHVAFTGLSPDRLTALASLLDDWEREAAR